jgi:phosphoglycolate phosphatase
MKNWDLLLWDLDGTITDPKFGIIKSYQKLLEEYQRPVLNENMLLWVIGPPLRECINKVLSITDSKETEKAVERFRYWYGSQKLMYLDTPYKGIPELLSTLFLNKQKMYIATSKAHPYAKEILAHWKLDRHFIEINGSELDGTRGNKAELLAWMCKKNGWDDRSKILMIGDRHHDIDAAKANQIKTLGVAYGYGGRQELESAKAEIIIETVSELSSILIS